VFVNIRQNVDPERISEEGLPHSKLRIKIYIEGNCGEKIEINLALQQKCLSLSVLSDENCQ